jgi:hypothetical protein
MMTKTFTLLALTFSIQTFAQSLWPHENAEWWADVTYSLFLPAEYHHYVNGDTVIAGVTCTRIKTEHIFAYPNEPENVQTFFVREEYVHFNGDTLFWWKQDDFWPLICFNAEVGDSWYPMPFNEISVSCDSIPVTVISKDSVQYDGLWYRRLQISGGDWQESPYFWQGTFDERTFGRTYFYPEYNECNSIIEWLMFSFRCYDDGEIEINNSNWGCGSLLLSTDQYFNEREVIIFPNPLPVGSELHVGDFDRLEIVDLNGRLIETFDSTDEKIVPSLPAGVYVIRLFRGDLTAQRKLLVR